MCVRACVCLFVCARFNVVVLWTGSTKTRQFSLKGNLNGNKKVARKLMKHIPPLLKLFILVIMLNFVHHFGKK